VGNFLTANRRDQTRILAEIRNPNIEIRPAATGAGKAGTNPNILKTKFKTKTLLSADYSDYKIVF